MQEGITDTDIATTWEMVYNISDAAYRQRLSRASRKITNFMKQNCGLINPEASCQCKRRILIALKRERINPDMLLHYTESRKIRDYLAELNSVDSFAQVFRDNPYYDKKENFSPEIREKILSLAKSAS